MAFKTYKQTSEDYDQSWSNWRQQLHIIIFEHNTPAGRLFDVVLLWAILLSVLFVILESVQSIKQAVGDYRFIIEWVFTIGFTLEYFARIVSIKKPKHYIFSFYGIVDLLSILPTYLGIFFTGGTSLMIIRGFRLIRVFRILKLSRYFGEWQQLTDALKASRYRILVFFLIVLNLVVVMGTFMYIVEGGENGFENIPISIYWAIVTMTTVGYGDIAPITPLGKALASFIMLFGYAIIAVPTGIITSELTKEQVSRDLNPEVCDNCGAEDHTLDAKFCRKCGSLL